jgi:hypothetical protein
MPLFMRRFSDSMSMIASPIGGQIVAMGAGHANLLIIVPHGPTPNLHLFMK